MTSPTQAAKPPTRRLVIIAAAGLAVTAAIFIFGRVHTPDSYLGLFGRSYANVIPLKSLLATIALVLAGVQLVLALWIYQKLPGAGRAPKPVGLTHRVVGGVALVVTLPVALHCLLAYGVQFYTPRVAIHSIAGCFFYGVFVAKVIAVQSRRISGWVLPVAGGLLVVILVVLWYTSSLWYYNGFSLP